MESIISDVKLDYNFFFSEMIQGSAKNSSGLRHSSCAVACVYKSLQLGLSPDSPSTSGAITRVVEGVNIYSLSNPTMYEC